MKYIVLKEQENLPGSTPQKEMAAFGDWLAKHQKYCHISQIKKEPIITKLKNLEILMRK